MYFFHKAGYFVLLFTSVICIRKCYKSILQKPVLTALLELHSGLNCEYVNYHGLQQMAALESTMKIINEDFDNIGIQLDLQVFDTCTNNQGALIAALKALKASKQTCMKTPLFVGFIGPEDGDALNMVEDISTLFRIPHIIPYSHEKMLRSNTFSVAQYPIKQHTKVIELLLKKLDLQRVLIIAENNQQSKWKAEVISKTLGETYCLSRPLIIQSGHINHSISQFNQEFTAILAIIESPELLEHLIEETKHNNITLLISIGKIGLISWPETLCQVYIIQMISSTPLENLNELYDESLMKEFTTQMSAKCDKHDSTKEKIICDLANGGYQDWSVNQLRYSALLYASNIRTAYNMKCIKDNVQTGLCPKLKYITRKEWNQLLANATVNNTRSDDNANSITDNSNNNNNIVINYNMEANVTYLISILEDALIKIGEYKNDELNIENGYLEEVDTINNSSSICKPFIKATLNPTNDNSLRRYFDVRSPLESLESIDIHNLSYYELVGLISGIAAVTLVIFVTIFYVVYRTFSTRSNVSSKGGSTRSRSSIRSE